MLLAKFSYLKASTNLECRDSWKVQHISWLYNAVSDIFSLALSQSWVEFKRNFSKRYFSLVNFKVFKNSKVLKGWILKTVCKLNLPWEEGWWDSFEDIKTFTAFLAPSPSPPPLSILPIQIFCILHKIPQTIPPRQSMAKYHVKPTSTGPGFHCVRLRKLIKLIPWSKKV